MSMNIYLEGTRVLTTKSGREIIDRKKVKFIKQTPSKVTYEILEKETFEDKLNTYCEWEQQYKDCGFCIDVFDDDMLEFYKNYNNSDYLYEYEGVDEGKELRTHFVDKIYLEGEEGFEKHKDNLVGIIAVVVLKDRPVKETLELIIKDMREDEYSLEWGMW
jgi:hypothetical protein